MAGWARGKDIRNNPESLLVLSVSRPVSLLFWLLLLLLVLAPEPASAQFTRFQNYSDEQGLGNASVTGFAQDPDGYLLLGTQSGLYRFDGRSMAPVDDQPSLRGAWISQITVDAADRVWMIVGDELLLRRSGRFGRVNYGSGHLARSPHMLAATAGSVVLDVGGVPMRASVAGDVVGPFVPLVDQGVRRGVPDAAVFRFVAADGADGWMGGCGLSLCRVDASGSLTVIGAETGLPRERWQVARVDDDGTLWLRSVGMLAWRKAGDTGFGSVAIPGGTETLIAGLPQSLDLVPDGHGGILTQGGQGLAGWDGTFWKSYGRHAGGLGTDDIQSLMFDREGSLWIGSYGWGAYRSIGLGQWEHWSVDDGLASNAVWGMGRPADGLMWVAAGRRTAPLGGSGPGLAGSNFTVATTRQGRIWTAPFDASLHRLDPVGGQQDTIPSPGIVYAGLLDHADRLWLAGRDALYLVPDADAPTGRLSVQVALPGAKIGAMAIGPDGALWVASLEGLFRRDGDGHFRRVLAPAQLSGEATSLCFFDARELWIGTAGFGVLRFSLERGVLRPLPSIAASVLHSDTVVFLLRDRRQRLWVGTDHGIDMRDGQTWRHFDTEDGLIGNDLDQWAVFEDTDGSMWFGTSHGLSHLMDPDHLSPAPDLHPLITALTLNDRPVPLAPAMTIDAGRGSFAIRFVDLDFARPRGVSFRYRLRGLDTSWQETVEHEVRYGNLPSGLFQFDLVAIDAVHGTVSAPIGFRLRVRAPWWLRWWSILAAVLVAILTFVAAWRGRGHVLLMRQHRLEEMVTVRTAEIEHARGELQRIAMSDALTGLPNRRAILAALDEAVMTSRRANTSLAVLLCDIDHFKLINDRFGHLAGDDVLATFGDRLSSVLCLPEIAGRYGGEEFLIIMPGQTFETVQLRLDTIRSVLVGSSYVVAATDRVVTLSGGLAILESRDDAMSLLARADAALYLAKEAGRDRIEGGREGWIGGNGASPLTPERILVAELRDALRAGEFMLQYQPVVDLRRDEVTSCEALLRWRSPSRGLVPPARFIPFAERAGLMPDIGDWVLRAAAVEAASWPSTRHVSVNLSPSQFRQPDLVERVVAILDQTGLPAHRLELEITETAMIDDISSATAILKRLRALGISIALDDFGTGYSSLSFLRTLPFDRIKIDRSFVSDLGIRPEAGAIVGAVIGLCAGLGTAVTAEGVESERQIALLREAGCREVQGYGVGRPCSAADLSGWIEAFAKRRVAA